MKELTKSTIILVTLPISMAILAVLTTSKWFVIPILFPLFVVFFILNLNEKPKVNISVEVDKKVLYVDENLRIKLKVSVTKGYGLILIRGPPIPKTPMAEGFELVKGTNVHVIFKGFKDVYREFEYSLKAVKRGYYSLEGVTYTFYHPFGVVENIKAQIRVDEKIQVLPKIKIISRLPINIRPVEGFPRLSPSLLGPYSTEFLSVREYNVGDPYKFINWKATARNAEGKFMVNEYEREGLRTVALLLDRGLWMRYGSDIENPMEYGISLVLSLGKILLEYGYNVGLWIFPKGQKVLPSSDSDQYYRLLKTLVSLKDFASGKISPLIDRELLQEVQSKRPIAVLITNINDNNVEDLGEISKMLKSRTLIIDIIPDTLLMKSIVPEPPCTQWFIRSRRERLYKMLPSYVKVISWDPACEDIGSIIARAVTYLGRWSR